MILVNKRLSYSRGLVGDNIYMFTSNSTIKNNGRLTMGAGCAKAVRDCYQDIDKLFGEKIDINQYGVEFVQWNDQHIGAFQTKYPWQKDSPLSLIEYSCRKLKSVAERRNVFTFHLPFPAVGFGNRGKEEVMPLVKMLPDNVIVYLG
ncbi:conserved hypothetical protein [Vibrio phage 496E54-1]|nr:conserved hypothetical protein [Vibrio phage 495E54-1]CAH9014218.1 conserved hypothetical protein [Vibrio phage 496E54-1]